MNDVLAVLEHDGDEKVLAGAEALAALLGASVRRLDVRDEDEAGRTEAVVTALRGDLVAAVLSAQGRVPVCWRVIERVPIPLLVIPEHNARVAASFSEALLPLDGTPETATGVAAMAGRLVDAGVHVLAMHVFDASTVPAFWDQAAHSHEHWTEEFLLKNLPAAVDLDLSRGATPEQVVATARRIAADLVMIGWAQDLGQGRALTVRHALTEGSVPVLLLPVRSAPRPDPTAPSTLDVTGSPDAG